MSSRLIEHIINNLSHNFDDFIKSKIKEYYIPKYVDIEIYEEYRELIPRRISTLSLPRVIRNIVLHFRNLNYKIYDNPLYGLSLSYLHSIEDQDLCYYEFDDHQNDNAIVGFNLYTDNITTMQNIIHELVGDEWTKTYRGKYPQGYYDLPDSESEYDPPDSIDYMMISEYRNYRI